MKFTKSKVVIHPQHGPSTVKKVGARTLRGERVEYLTLLTHDGDLSVSIPSDRAAEIGVRRVMDVQEVREIFELMTGESEPHNRIWSRRFRDYNQRVRSGDISTVAGLIRDLIRRNEERRISYGEMGVLREATALLTSEIALSLELTTEEVSTLIDDAVLRGVVPTLVEDDVPVAG